MVKNGEISPKTDVYFLKNSDNFCWFKIDEFEMDKKMIIDFINQKVKCMNVMYDLKRKLHGMNVNSVKHVILEHV